MKRRAFAVMIGIGLVFSSLPGAVAADDTVSTGESVPVVGDEWIPAEDDSAATVDDDAPASNDELAPVSDGSVPVADGADNSGETAPLGDDLTPFDPAVVLESEASVETLSLVPIKEQSPALALTLPFRLPSEQPAAMYLNDQWSTTAGTAFTFGRTTDTFIVGDWDGDGRDTMGIRYGESFYLRYSHGDGAVDSAFVYGKQGDEVFVGDWDGDGRDTLAVRRGSVFYIQNSLKGGAAAQAIAYGLPGDEVFVGDWDGDGKDTLAIRRGSVFHIRNSMTSGPADELIAYGKPGDKALVGDWDGDGKDTLAVRRNNTYYVRNSMTSGLADLELIYGRVTDEVIVGDWNGDRSDTLGVIRRDGQVPTTNADQSPRINVDSAVSNGDGTVTITGWAFDPDTAGSMPVQIFVDNESYIVAASLTRADVKSVFGLSYASVGFRATVTASTGNHTVCVSAVNQKMGSNTWSQCLPVTVAIDPDVVFVPGNIMSDAVMFTPGTMSEAQIQAFLQQKNPNCIPGESPCLKDYAAPTKTMTARYCQPYQGSPNERVSSMIFKAANACGVNPQVLIVFLQKEQGLVSASGANLTALKYSKALGFGCPDGVDGCNPAYAGIEQQLYAASAQLVRYGEEPNRFNFRAGATTPVLYNPNVSCGSSPVTFANRATAALYNYTPYQPNKAALANMYGEGDACSTYGNRNVWRLMITWFGRAH